MAVRPIDAEKYIELLKEQYLHHKSMGNKQMAKAWQGAMQLLYDMPTLTPSNEWVSVEEGLPSPWEEVLVFSEPYVDVGYLLETGDFYSIRGFNNITHWMPLPAPPDRRPPEGEEDTE